jgi:hypothetical protein
MAGLPDGGFVLGWPSSETDLAGYEVRTRRSDAACNTLDGAGFVDTMRGADGNETLFGGAGKDTLGGGGSGGGRGPPPRRDRHGLNWCFRNT